MGNPRVLKTCLSFVIAILVSIAMLGSAAAALPAQDPPPEANTSQIEVISPYYSIQHLTTVYRPDRSLTGVRTHG